MNLFIEFLISALVNPTSSDEYRVRIINEDIKEHIMSGKYVSEKPTRGYNDPAPEVVRGKRVTQEAFAKAGACRNLPAQSKANYGKTDYK